MYDLKKKSLSRPCLLGSCIALFAAFGLATAARAAEDRIVTASESGTYIEIGRDLSRLVAQPAGLSLAVLPSKGSADNVRRLRDEPGVRLALVQADVYRAFLDQARAGDADASRLIKPLRVVLPLYDEEIYFVARADSTLRHVHEVRGQRLNVGPVGSGTALTATTLYRAMFGAQLPEQDASHWTNEEALIKLVTDRSIDVAVIVAGQPSKLFADMKPEARQYIKLLAVDPKAAESQAVAGVYGATTIRSGGHAPWLAQDVPALSVKSLLVTYDFQSPPTRDHLTRLAQSMCLRLDQLKKQGHAKWREISLAQPPLPTGWSYYAPTRQVLSQCAGALVAKGPAEPPACPQNRQVLGLCQGKRENAGR